MKRQDAISFFQQKAEANPMDADAHHNLAVLYKSAGDHALHARHSRIASLTQRGGPKVANELALALMEQGKLDDAREKLEKVIACWPMFAYSYVNMSALLARKGRHHEALPFCVSALKYAPRDPALHRNIAKVYERLGRTSDALVHYQRALSLAPDDSALAKRIALLSLSRGQTSSSVAHYTHYRSLKGEHYDLKL
ncbi:Transmembrane and tpr repeat-containing protein 1 [Globisporangium polare]